MAAACSSACVVDSGAAIGPYNRENLELLRAAAGAGVPVLTLRRERLESLEAARPFDTVRALMDEAARLAAGKGEGCVPRLALPQALSLVLSDGPPVCPAGGQL